MRRLAPTLALVLVSLGFWSNFSAAQEGRSYFYAAIDYQIAVNADSTFDVVERQTYQYRGEYHQGWRDIPLNKISDVDEVSVVDGATGQPLVYSSKRLDKLDPASWGRYAVFRQNGRVNIEWYYSLANTTHEWVLRYKVHGGLSFLKDKDELYWNLFTDYDVPVNALTAAVILPSNTFAPEQLQVTGYGEPVAPAQTQVLDNRTFVLRAYELPAYEKLTIAAGWPLGLIDRGAFWRDWFSMNWAYLLATFLLLATVIYSVIYWYKTEHYQSGRGTIVPQYEPPEKLPPAMAEVICKEKITDKAWPATVVDLAARGYLKIREDGLAWLALVQRFMILPVVAIFVLIGLISGNTFIVVDTVLITSFFVVMLISKGRSLRDRFSVPKDYVIERVEPGASAAPLKKYEEEFLWALFGGHHTFSTKLLRQGDNETKRAFYHKMQSVKKKLYQETENNTGSYAVGLTQERKRNIGLVIGLFVAVFVFTFVGSFLSLLMSAWYIVLGAVIIICLAWLYSLRFEARLNKRGQILKEDWLGFKLYLETAERYRLQNLTPDLFEKYLPYAIIFGVEKQWGQAFQAINIVPPQWYSSASGLAFAGSGGFSSSGAVGTFSASAFSASFASSFSSAFASAGGGASGGGGGAGGGGGGGGGGAS